VFGDEPFTCFALASRLLEKDEQGQDLRETLPGALTKNLDNYLRSQGQDRALPEHMGKAFGKKLGAYFGTLCLHYATEKYDRKHKTQWQISHGVPVPTLPPGPPATIPARAAIPATIHQARAATGPSEGSSSPSDPIEQQGPSYPEYEYLPSDEYFPPDDTPDDMTTARDLLTRMAARGCSLRIRDDSSWGISVPEHWNDERYQKLHDRILSLDGALRQLLTPLCQTAGELGIVPVHGGPDSVVF
jgi:hypothetical protein